MFADIVLETEVEEHPGADTVGRLSRVDKSVRKNFRNGVDWNLTALRRLCVGVDLGAEPVTRICFFIKRANCSRYIVSAMTFSMPRVLITKR